MKGLTNSQRCSGLFLSHSLGFSPVCNFLLLRWKQSGLPVTFVIGKYVRKKGIKIKIKRASLLNHQENRGVHQISSFPF